MVSDSHLVSSLVAGLLLFSVALAEFLHVRRTRAVMRLTFGPDGRPRRWTAVVPVARALSLAALGWGLALLLEIEPKVFSQREISEDANNRLLIAYDVSPSMCLEDAGLGRDSSEVPGADGAKTDPAGFVPVAGPVTRARRAAQVVESILQRVNLRQTLTTVVAFHTEARPVVIDAKDVAVVRNIFDELPLRFAFPSGKTDLMNGAATALGLAEDWPAQSTTLLVISDGDTIGEEGAPALPPSISSVVVVGVGPAGRGSFIDGHFSKQDAGSLSRLAQRLGGTYVDADTRQVPTETLASLIRPIALEYTLELGAREYALAGIGAGAAVFAGIPVLLALAGSSWRVRPAGRSRAATSTGGEGV